MEGNAISMNPGSSNYSLVDLHRSSVRDTQLAGGAQGMVPGSCCSCRGSCEIHVTREGNFPPS